MTNHAGSGNFRRSTALLLLLNALCPGLVLADEGDLVFVAEKVQPLLRARCGQCHGTAEDRAGEELKGGFSTISRSTMLQGGDSGPAIVPAHPEQSLLMSAVRYESFEMPPRSRMPAEEIAILEEWIRRGAPWPQGDSEPAAASTRSEFPLRERKAAHWAWQPITAPPVPDDESGWSDSAIDRWILQQLRSARLTPAPDAERRALLRRLYFDLVGLPPTIEQQQAFLNDSADIRQAMEKVVDQLLQSPHFGERWARHWLDLVRYAETLGHEFDYPLPHAWQYRDYVIRAFNEDVPWNQIIREHVAGDLLPEPRRNRDHGFNESVIATGFWYLGEDKHAPVDVRGEEAARMDNQIDVFSKTFLGLTVSCARCHDHKFDAITSQDYYALAGYLQSSRRRVAWLDADQHISSAVQRIRSLRDDLRRRLQAARNPEVAQQIAQVTAALLMSGQAGPVTAKESEPGRTLQQDGSRGVDSIWSLPAVLMQHTGTSDSISPGRLRELVTHWSQQVLQQEAADHAAADSGPLTLLADFRQGLPDGWMCDGDAFSHMHGADPSASVAAAPVSSPREGNREAQPAALSSSSVGPAAARSGWGQSGWAQSEWTDEGPRIVVADAVSSSALAPGLKGMLHSPTFELTGPEILVEVAGRASRMRLVIDGYVMNEFSELLFRGARQPIDTGGEYRWIRIGDDVQRYQGHRAHLEFLDEGGGWFSVRRVFFARQSGTSAPEQPGTNPVNSVLARRLQTLLADSSSELTIPDVISAWTDVMMQDRAWAIVADRCHALPILQTPAWQETLAQWKTVAAQVPEGQPVLVMCDGSPENEHLLIRGSHRNPGPIVQRRFLEALSESEPSAAAASLEIPGSGRLDLAERLVSDDNPLVARVLVNRVWQHLLGNGIVSSVDNFGVLGERPSHPELLDHLADEFRRDGWSIHRLIRRITLSHVYRMSSQRSDAGELADPTNRLLHRANVRRLESESIRDAILTVSGRLNDQLYGRSVPVHLTPFMQGRGRPGKSGPLDGDGRRSIYQAVHRNFLSPFMLAFDAPIPATAVGRRSVSNVPAQALILLNNEFVSQQAAVWADRLLAQQFATLDELLNTACQQAWGRPATPTDLAAMRAFAEAASQERDVASGTPFPREVIVDLCHVLLNQKEFVFLD